MRRYVHVEKSPTDVEKPVKKREKRLQKREKNEQFLRTNAQKTIGIAPIDLQLRSMSLQEKVFHLRTNGYNEKQIAEKLNLTHFEVAQLVMDAFEEYYEKRDKAVQKFLGFASAVYDRLLQTWMPKATDHVETIRTDSGPVEVIVPGDAEAARIVATYMRDAAKMYGLNKTRVEVTGKDGGAIKLDADWTLRLSDDQMEKVAAGDLTLAQALALPGPNTSPSDSGTSEEEEEQGSRLEKHH